MRKRVCVFLAVLVSSIASAQQVDLKLPALADETTLAVSMSSLARQVIAVYRESDRARYLANLLRLQIVAGEYASAAATMALLNEFAGAANTGPLVERLTPLAVYAQAKARQVDTQLSFEAAYKQSFSELCGRMDDRTAVRVLYWFVANLNLARQELKASLDQQKSKDRIALADALDLVSKYLFAESYGSSMPMIDSLVAQDDARRYIADDVLIRTVDGAGISAQIVRSRSTSAPLPALLELTIYTYEQHFAKESAAHGYVGVTAYSRGKRSSQDAIMPFEHDGNDARAVIDWITKQPWSDGRVAMYGGSYSGFTQWAAAKRLPAALKAIATSATVVPGIDVPMQGNIFVSFIYPWIPYVTNTKLLDDATYGDRARWSSLDKSWYTSGQSYRSLDRIDGTPNPIFHKWLDHPSYDRYWQKMIPYREDFAGINIPVLATTGYDDGGQIGVLYYLAEHYKYNPRADHTLLVGPYHHTAMQTGPFPVLRGYPIDPVARIDLRRLRYQWFDHVLKGGPKPTLLKDKINYEVMGANEWKHAPSLHAMANGSLRFYLTRAADSYRLSEHEPSRKAFIEQAIDFTDRSDADYAPATTIIRKTLDTRSGIAFVSEPLQQSIEVSGLFSAQLDFIANKKDMDIKLALYEQMPSGEYFELSQHMFRASYARDRSQRHLLVPGIRQRLNLTSHNITSRKFQAGSRIAMVLSINKQADRQINYGTGKDVSSESIKDAKAPLLVKWYGASFVDIPIWKETAR